MEYIEKLKALKEERKLTITDISSLSGVPMATVTRIFNGTTPNPQFDTVIQIAMVFGISLDELIGLDRPEEPQMPSPVAETFNSYAELLHEKDRYIEELQKEKEREHHEKGKLALAFVIFVGFVLLLLTVDILNGHFGYFRY